MVLGTDAKTSCLEEGYYSLTTIRGVSEPVTPMLFRKQNAPTHEPADRILTRIVIPLRNPIDLDGKALARRYHAEWGGVLKCETLAMSRPNAPRLRLSEEGETLNLSGEASPIPQDLVEASIDSAKQSALPSLLDDHGIAAYRENRAHLIIESPVSRETGRFQCALAVQVLLTMLKGFDATVGYNAVSALMYRSRDPVLALLAKNPKFDASSMFNLLGNVHAVRNEAFWLHTHGMEQFGLPDLEVHFDDGNQRGYFMRLLGNAAVYMIHQGRVLKVGDTSEMAGDGIGYRIVPVKPNPGHQFGRLGAVAISRT